MRRTLPICIALLLALTTACSAPGAASTSQASVSSAPAQPTQTTDPIPDKAAKPLNQFDLDVTLDPQAHQLKVKQTLTDICNYFGQLEYLGFDVAISSQGIRILEINKYQDLNRCAY